MTLLSRGLPMNQIRHCCRAFIIFIILSLFFALPGLAQTTKSKQTAKSQTSTGKTQPQSLRLNAENLEQASYRIWLNWYQARKAGQQPPTPVLDLPQGIDAQEVKHVQVIWQQSQVKAHMAMVEKDVYQIWLDWYEKGQPLPAPDLKLPEGINAQEAKQVRAVWQRVQLKAQKNAKPQKPEQADNSNGELAQQPLSQPQSANNQFNNLSGNQSPQGISNLSRMSASMKPPSNPTLTAANTANVNLVHQYDNAGNTTVIGSKSFGYNVDNQLTDMTDANTGNSAHMVYDVDGNLVRKTVGPKDNFGNFIPASSFTTSYLVDTNNITDIPQVLEETTTLNGVSTLTVRYGYGLGGIIDQQRLINGQWTTSFFQKDGHGAVRALTDINGNVTDTFDYDTYGNLINRTGTTLNNYRYAGERWDPDLGLYYNRSRYLNVDSGRFMTMDTYEGNNNIPLSLHKYIYAHNNPINKIDPTGRFAVSNAIVTNFLTSFASAPIFGNRNTAVRTFVGSDNPYNDLVGDNYTKTSLAIFSSQVSAQDPKCDKALIDFGVLSLQEAALGLKINVNIFDGRMSDLFLKSENQTAGSFLRNNPQIPAITFPKPISRNGDWPILLGPGFLSLSDKPAPPNGSSTADERELIVLHEAIHQISHQNDDFFGGSKELSFAFGSKCFPGKRFPRFYPRLPNK